MIRKLLYALASAAVLLTSCDNVDEGDRLVYVPPTPSARSILVEEFSGQLCVNCPDGSAVLEGLQEQYGVDTVIVVSFHADRINQGLKPGGRYIGLTTDEGGQLFDKYGCNSMPSAVFDRKSGVVNDYNMWNTYATMLLKEPTSLNLSVASSYDESTRSLDVTVTAQLASSATADLNGNIHVWLTEDSIVAPQRLKSGSYEFDHVFHNIFRASVNALDGDALNMSTTATEETVRTFHTTLDESWRAEKMNVIVFVDNDDGVCQAARASVTEK